MENEKIAVVLVGKENTLNRTILEMIEEDELMQVEFWPVAALEQRLKDRKLDSVDVLLADLRSFSSGGPAVVRYLSKQQAVGAVLAIDIHTSLQPVKKLIEAGAGGYLSQDTSEQQILRAVKKLHRGNNVIGIDKNVKSVKKLR